ncbi:MAG: MFS transporter [Alphaproteobacteria bacterium]|jgi:MFS family permease
MSNKDTIDSEAEIPKAAWGDLFRDGRGIYSTLVVLGVCLHALQILVIAIVMPTVVADIGGADYYTWPAMLYTIGSILGAACVGPLWAWLGVRKGYGASALAFLVGTVGCALSPDMLSLNIARGVQGLASGLVVGGGMALVSGLFAENLRKRVLAAYQGTWMVAQLLGPVMGGLFAQIGWWRGSFWSMVPIILVFAVIALKYLPDHLPNENEAEKKIHIPLLRLLILSSGVFCVALAGRSGDIQFIAPMIAGAVFLIWLAFKLDRQAENKMYPARALSIFSPVGLALWIMLLVGMVHTTVPLLLPLLLQVVHGVDPIWVSLVSLVISGGWTVGTFAVSGWSGRKEIFALWAGPLLMMVGLAGVAITATEPLLVVLVFASFVMGFGMGIQNVHLIARTMAAAEKGEERITSSAMPSIRSLGTAFGAATAGLVTNLAGLGTATTPEEVGPAVTASYSFNMIPLIIAALMMFWLLRLTRDKPDG